MLQQIGAEPQATWRLVAILIAIGPALVVYNWLFDYMIQYNLGDKGIDVVGCGCILVAHVPYLDIDDVFERKDFKDYRFWKTTRGCP